MAMDLPLKVILTNVLDSRGWAWDLCADVRDSASASQFAYAALPEDTRGGDNKFYQDAPRHIFAAVLKELVNRKVPWTLRTAYLLAMDDRYAEELCRTSADPGVRMARRLFNKDMGSTKSNIDASLLTKLGNLETYAALMEHAEGKFSLRDMVRSDVVLVAGGDFRFNHIIAPMNYLMLTCLKHELLGQAKSHVRRHYVFIDEFAAVNHDKPADEVLDLFVRGRSRGVRLCIAVHTPEQLVHVYQKPMANVILANCQHKLILKVGDYDGASCCSQLLGHVYGYEWTHNVSTSHTSGAQPSTTHSRGAQETWADRSLVPPSVNQELPLASLEHGIHGFGILSGDTGTHRWRFHLSPQWLERHVVRGADEVKSYEACRRGGHQQTLQPLSQTEVEGYGLTYHRED